MAISAELMLLNMLTTTDQWSDMTPLDPSLFWDKLGEVGYYHQSDNSVITKHFAHLSCNKAKAIPL